jgi:hypothetical protein
VVPSSACNLAWGPVVLGEVPLDFLRADRGADELVDGVAQLEGALGDAGDGPGQEGPLRPQPGGSDHVEHLFLGAVDDDLGLESSHDVLLSIFRWQKPCLIFIAPGSAQGAALAMPHCRDTLSRHAT